jgi:hypothetical protein
MKRWGTAAAMLVSCVLLVLPLPASAATSSTRVVSTVSGAQIASELVAQLRGVQVGSTSATLTVGSTGKAAPIRFEFGDVTQAVEGQPGGWLTLAALPMIGAAAIRFLSFLAKLGGN